MTKTVIGAATTSAGLQTVPVAGGSVQSKAGVRGTVVADGTYLYSLQGTGEAPGVYRRTSATGAASLVVPLPATKYPTRQYGVSVSPGRVYYTNGLRDPDVWHSSYDVMMRTTTTGSGKITLGAEQKLGLSSWSALSGSAGWLQYDGRRLRSQSGAVTTLPDFASAPPEMSGHRVLLKNRVSTRPYDAATPAMYDLRTRKLTVAWPEGPQDLFGNYFAYADGDGSVRVKDLSNGRIGVHRASGAKLGAVAIHGQWMAWFTACQGPAWPCIRTLTVRNPAYLSDAIAPASMSTSWTMQLPVSKALPTCQVTIYYGSTKVRILNCANTTGLVAVTWNGKSGSGANVTKGKYTYRVTGLDADRYNLRNYNGTLTPVGGSITKTA